MKEKKPTHKVIYKANEKGEYLGMFQLCNQKKDVGLTSKHNLTLYDRCVTCKNCKRKLKSEVEE